MRIGYDDLAFPISGEVMLEDLESDTDPKYSYAHYYGYDEACRMHELLPELAMKARLAAQREAVSYRDFLVGAAAYATDIKNRRFGILFGANLKPSADSPKWCAEMEVLQKATDKGYTKILGLAVSGPLQPDSVSGVVSKTLHPCSDCRNNFRTHPLIYPDTRLLMVDEHGAETEALAIRDFFRVHGEDFFTTDIDPREQYLKLMLGRLGSADLQSKSTSPVA